mmetsp:Transcript_26353/g.86221  ORF Transcript_26353/g.86221 Transcript_26353/m.86221 type:complete len:226 (-) Transcript_26353:38-715(-)
MRYRSRRNIWFSRSTPRSSSTPWARRLFSTGRWHFERSSSSRCNRTASTIARKCGSSERGPPGSCSASIATAAAPPGSGLECSSSAASCGARSPSSMAVFAARCASRWKKVSSVWSGTPRVESSMMTSRLRWPGRQRATSFTSREHSSDANLICDGRSRSLRPSSRVSRLTIPLVPPNRICSAECIISPGASNIWSIRSREIVPQPSEKVKGPRRTSAISSHQPW